ncbi:hypothetical protein [Streptomyces sp. SPB78]|uniref:hypothetical protein n=1 Tax=Streptomyces sp. (strain SPB78) TaxID=591157 RepID=UPI0001B578E1|nr:hypothetical protein [Streptomyces sp. SPB78]
MNREEEAREDLRKLKRFADEIERAMDLIDPLAGADTWKGPRSERFREDWASRQKAVRKALSDARGQMAAKVAQVEREEEEKRRGKAAESG